MPGHNVELGRRLRDVRRHRGLTQAELGQRCGLGNRQIGKYERGQSATTVATLARLAAGLHCAVTVLLKPPGASLPSR